MANLFSKNELRGLVILLPLARIFAGIALYMQRRQVDDTACRIQNSMEAAADSLRLRNFDPNTVDFRELQQLGFTKVEAVSLLKYRASGKIFRIPEDVATCYNISDSLYDRLEPYIRIGRKYAIAPKKYSSRRVVAEPLAPSQFRIDTVSVAYLYAIGAFSIKQAREVVKRQKLSGFFDISELRAFFAVDDSVATALEPYIIFPERRLSPIEQPIEINRADSAALRSVVGIGERTVTAIMLYRQRLGGFCRVEQLSEVPGVMESNYEKILKQIYCDSCEIQKIDINFAGPEKLGKHPYVPHEALRRLLKTRQLKGGWSSTEELINDKILTRKEAARLAPYLQFSPHSAPEAVK